MRIVDRFSNPRYLFNGGEENPPSFILELHSISRLLVIMVSK